MSVSAPTSYQEFPARLFARGAMVCPRCRAPWTEAPESCPNCSYDFATSVESFPFAPPPLEFFMNPAEILPPEVPDEIRERYELVRERFPEIRMSFCFVQLASGTPLSEFAFWLFNSAPESNGQQAWRLLLTVDLGAGRISLNAGYALEPFIDPAAWKAPMNTCAAAFAHSDWSGGLNEFIDQADSLLETAWKEAMATQKETGTSP